MTTLFAKKHKLYEWSPKIKANKISVGNPLTCEYRFIQIVSKDLDSFSSSEVMVVNYVKHFASKESALQSITYYDKKIESKSIPRKDLHGGGPVKKAFSKTIDKVIFKERRKIQIGPFDSSEYGHPVCFHTPGYVGSVINVTTSLWEINDNTLLKTASELIKRGISMLSGISAFTPYSPYISMASSAFGVSSQILVESVKHEELAEDHTLELRLDSDNHPLFCGKYICFPTVRDRNEKIRILNTYKLYDNKLVHESADGKWTEYDGTYFVIKVSNRPRNELADFDFTASSAEMLKKLSRGMRDEAEGNNFLQELMQDKNNSIQLDHIKDIEKAIEKYESTKSDADAAKVVAIYNHLSAENKESISKYFPNLQEILNTGFADKNENK